MATYINGFGGSATFAAEIMPVENWSLNVNAEALDTTNTADAGWESNITGAKSWEGSAKMFFDSADTPTNTLVPGSSGTVSLAVGATAKAYAGSCRITQVTIENAAKGVVTVSVSFKGNGALTFPT